MREYETIFVIRPDGKESQTKQLLDKLNGLVERHKGAVLQCKNLGKKDLAYKVKKYNQGIYYYYNYASDSGAVSEFERTLRYDDLAMKYLTVKLNDNVDVDARKSEISAASVEIKAVDEESKTEEVLEERDEEEVEDA